jgi:hypothetical protein
MLCPAKMLGYMLPIRLVFRGIVILSGGARLCLSRDLCGHDR